MISDAVKKLSVPGALSPLHTRRGTHGDTSISVAPDFATFDLAPLRTWINEITQRGGLRSLLENAHRLQEDMDKMLAHNIEHQKKIAGELAFQTTGDYPPNDISTRLMPNVQLMELKTLSAPCRKDHIEKVVFDEEFEQESVSSGDFGWPPVDLPRKLWVWLRQYADPIDENFIVKWQRSIISRFLPENMAKIHEMGSEKKAKIGQQAGTRNRKPSLTVKLSQDTQYEMRSPTAVKDQPLLMPQTVSLKRLASEDHLKGRQVLPTKRHRSSITSPKMLPLMDDLVKAYFEEQGADHSPQHNGVFDAGDKRKMLTRKESVFNGNGRGMEPKVWKREMDEDCPSEDLRMNGHAPDTASGSGVAECAGTLAKLGRALKEHFNKNDFSVKHDSSSESSDLEEETTVNNSAEKSGEGMDEVTMALMNSQKELYEHEEEYRRLVAKVWNRLLAKHLRDKRESDLNKASRELYEVYDKYFCEFPTRRPANEREREECRAVMRKCVELSNRFYGVQKAKARKEQ
ncbi:unnamed protein product [Toxocara canis]|uniref:DUF4485 domain-containing protein n=1 Tax=Toxocara canis TaxID=6265 RepID=A0A183UPM7_TOXCA|nr:unnamed protein product [Toxocara canis]